MDKTVWKSASVKMEEPVMLFLVPVPVKRAGKELYVTHHVLLESMDPTAQTPVNVRMMATVILLLETVNVLQDGRELFVQTAAIKDLSAKTANFPAIATMEHPVTILMGNASANQDTQDTSAKKNAHSICMEKIVSMSVIVRMTEGAIPLMEPVNVVLAGRDQSVMRGFVRRRRCMVPSAL